MAARPRAGRALRARGRGHARQDDDVRDARVDPRSRGTEPGFPDRRRAARLRRLGTAHRQRVLRDRGRRVRHRVLRQALEVRPLPPAYRDPQQPRVRPRRHLPGPRGDRDPVPPLRAHDTRGRPHRRQRRGGEPRPRARARLLVVGRALRRGRGGHRRGPRAARVARRARRQGHARRRAAGPHPLANRQPAHGAPQPHERARGDRRGTARGRAGRGEPRGARDLPRRQAPHGGARHGARRDRLRRLRAPPDGDRHDDRGPAPARRRPAHPRGARAALEHDEARHGQGPAAGGARGGRPHLLLREQPRLGRDAARSHRSATGRRCTTTSTRWSRRSLRARAAATTCW